ncbi:GrpB family protein [Pelomonas sp. CA6]|uniref:GrpB family protein n=1 Tax=Pelomonas sp. CA6 TaxID=2907999 RepID=UPI001F4BA3C4|nr:GrpB family protein [Pelomonas sp. CA6]MCH7342003.1 GrpB family protein [Pelomonas sp. CA6]
MTGMDTTREPWPTAAEITRFELGDPTENPWVLGRPRVESIEVQPHDPSWLSTFRELGQALAAALSERARAIEHVGSTAVPGLAAKPVIDIDLIVEDPDDEDAYLPALQSLGYVLTVRERSWYGHRMLRLEAPRAHVHVFGRRCPEHVRHLLFRDWLREHPEERERYAEAKQRARVGVDTAQAYNQRKEAVVRDIYRRIFAARGWLAPSVHD